MTHPQIELWGELGFPDEKMMQRRKRPGVRNNHDTGGRCKKAAEAVFEPSGARLSLHAVNSPPKRKRGHSGRENDMNKTVDEAHGWPLTSDELRKKWKFNSGGTAEEAIKNG